MVHLMGFLHPPPDMPQFNFLVFGELCISGRLGAACLHSGLWFLFCKCLTLHPFPCHLVIWPLWRLIYSHLWEILENTDMVSDSRKTKNSFNMFKLILNLPTASHLILLTHNRFSDLLFSQISDDLCHDFSLTFLPSNEKLFYYKI